MKFDPQGRRLLHPARVLAVVGTEFSFSAFLLRVFSPVASAS
jgi:hypothetical protein